MFYFTEMTICIMPQFLNKSCTIQCRSFLANDNKCLLYELSHLILPRIYCLCI